ncbi:nucleotidyltransferase family protein [Motiliproteus sp. SC1-56]|uniref:nucleotidyltransferase domain-containing protein n=1 Tax=Motiliproteus sp. SC1-56 TaxID=2799565 RepID=UPI001A8F7F50|nr:nucleotidyltransferase family protein [Motiliproteus sp. SC1-56]
MKPPLLINIWRTPERASQLSLKEWELLLRQARASDLGASLWLKLPIQVRQQAPQQAQAHFGNQLMLAERQQQCVRFEIQQIAKAVSSKQQPVTLLKGAAYQALGLPVAQGRTFSDIDLLVARENIADTEKNLMLAGWLRGKISDYDERYYRTWMHEIPPLYHRRRGSVIDLHHNLLPPSTTPLDSQSLRSAARPLPGFPSLSTLAPEDILLHSACHLFHEGEFERGLRGLCDLDQLVRHFQSAQEDLLLRAVARAEEIGLGRSLFYALRYAERRLGTPVPAAVQQACRPFAPAKPLLRIMDWAFNRVLVPHHASCDDLAFRVSRFLLYVRGHYLRMPPSLLIPHLLHKAFLTPIIKWREQRVAERKGASTKLNSL